MNNDQADNVYKIGDNGSEVVEIQRILIGWGSKEKPVKLTGVYDDVTEAAAARFQQAHNLTPTGNVCSNTFKKIDLERLTHRFEMHEYRCTCGKCRGFGSGRYENEYIKDKPETEPYHKFEYPGVDLTLVWALRALMHRADVFRVKITSGYRCWYDNNRHHRRTTNHMGKAVDFVNTEPHSGGSVRERIENEECARIREVGIEECGFQAGWREEGRASLEMPRHGAYTWVHLDTRCIPRNLRGHVTRE
ncbi:MAG: peptidoglycan-binding protein [Planctomycetes bacterium]|nr:peptidoglycan-binding protein [Planctomycetota bacterium]